jgi:hypothetical protein
VTRSASLAEQPQPSAQPASSVTSRNSTGLPARCLHCDTALPGQPRPRGGRKPRYCTEACKARAYRARQLAAWARPPEEVTLPSTAAGPVRPRNRDPPPDRRARRHPRRHRQRPARTVRDRRQPQAAPRHHQETEQAHQRTGRPCSRGKPALKHHVTKPAPGRMRETGRHDDRTSPTSLT